IPIVRGRGFEPGDTASSRPVVVISEAAVRRYFPGEDPLGQWITIGWGRPGGVKAGGEVVGVVGDVKQLGLAEENPPQIYLPHAPPPPPRLRLAGVAVVRRPSAAPRPLPPAVTAVVRSLDAELPIARLSTLDEVVARSISQPRFYVLLLGSFAGTAMLLAAL